MGEYARVIKQEGSENIGVCFWIEKEKVVDISDKMEEIHEDAYMNVYNWQAFFNHYLSNQHPELLEGLDVQPKLGIYVARYKHNPDNEKKANKLEEIIEDLIAQEEKVYTYLEKYSNEIQWD